MRKISVLGSLLVSLPLFAANQTFVPASGKGTPVTFDIAYTAGVHKGTAETVTGALVLDENNRLVKGNFTVPLVAMKTKNDTRDCHMREAMGIDYTHSSFPAQHVCDSHNQTPATGPDSVVFPNIDFELTSLVQKSGEALPQTLIQGTRYAMVLRGKFTMHGQTHMLDGGDAASTLEATLTAENGGLRLQSAFPVTLKDYGIIVKPSKLGPVTITTAEKATVGLNMVLAKQR